MRLDKDIKKMVDEMSLDMLNCLANAVDNRKKELREAKARNVAERLNAILREAKELGIDVRFDSDCSQMLESAIFEDEFTVKVFEY